MERILIVDDEPIVLSLCRTILDRGGYTVVTAENPIEALQIVLNAENRIALALVDVMMPGMTGIELAKRIKAVQPHAPIVLMSGFRPHEIARVAGKENPYPIIWKPFKTESLLRMIENSLSDKAEAPDFE